ncbi:hypothetical protein BHE90_016577 [Fusarium euwallaceae]|uniref:Uncharacterized protein n=2 Tax=Fusarium solani species complex TaxID=232080 RepID=A0A430L007_9HYPO|nr:hypothetical protein CEP51_016926 [Fusarium floridanum]RTE69049.1 hypothetical protein BHE90_016577 [Fusarium euwallaceae]
MKFALILASIATFSASVLADGHSLCACQVKSNGATNKAATQACCSRVGGQLTPQSLPAAGGILFEGYYCQGNDISGDKFYECCLNNGGRSSTCPQ